MKVRTEYLAATLNCMMAALALWIATAQPDKGKTVDLWGGSALYCGFVIMAGIWFAMGAEK